MEANENERAAIARAEFPEGPVCERDGTVYVVEMAADRSGKLHLTACCLSLPDLVVDRMG